MKFSLNEESLEFLQAKIQEAVGSTFIVKCDMQNNTNKTLATGKCNIDLRIFDGSIKPIKFVVSNDGF